jgi:hypothetical protein
MRASHPVGREAEVSTLLLSIRRRGCSIGLATGGGVLIGGHGSTSNHFAACWRLHAKYQYPEPPLTTCVRTAVVLPPRAPLAETSCHWFSRRLNRSQPWLHQRHIGRQPREAAIPCQRYRYLGPCKSCAHSTALLSDVQLSPVHGRSTKESTKDNDISRHPNSPIASLFYLDPSSPQSAKETASAERRLNPAAVADSPNIPIFPQPSWLCLGLGDEEPGSANKHVSVYISLWFQSSGLLLARD